MKYTKKNAPREDEAYDILNSYARQGLAERRARKGYVLVKWNDGVDIFLAINDSHFFIAERTPVDAVEIWGVEYRP